MFEIAQILDVHEVLGCGLLEILIVQDAEREGGSLSLRVVHLRAREEIELVLGLVVLPR